MVIRASFILFCLLISHPGSASDTCIRNVLGQYLMSRPGTVIDNSREFNDTKKLSAKINKDLRPLYQEITKAYEIGGQLRKYEAEIRRIELISPKTQAVKNQLHDLVMAHSALTRDMIDHNNNFILKMRDLLKKQGIPSEITKDLDETQAWRMFEGKNPEVSGREVLGLKLDFGKRSATNEGFNYYRRIQSIFGLDGVTLSLKDTASMGAGGIFFPHTGRLEVGPAGAINLLRQYVNVTGKHESRHAMFNAKRMRGEESIFHTQFAASPSGQLLNEKDFYAQFMSAEELYTFSTDLQSYAQVFKGDFITDVAKKEALLQQIRDGSTGLTTVGETTKNVSEKMIKGLETKIAEDGIAPDFGIDVAPNGSFVVSFADDLNRQSGLTFVSADEKKLLETYQSAVQELSTKSESHIFRKLADDGVNVDELKRRLEAGKPTEDDQRRVVSALKDVSDLPELRIPRENQLAAYRKILASAKARLEKLQKLATIQIGEAQKLQDLLNKGSRPEDIEEIRKQLFTMGKNVKEDYKGFALGPAE